MGRKRVISRAVETVEYVARRRPNVMARIRQSPALAEAVDVTLAGRRAAVRRVRKLLRIHGKAGRQVN